MKKFTFHTIAMLCLWVTGYSQVSYDDAVLGIGNLQHNYVGSWVHNATTPTFYNNTQSYSNSLDATVTFAFSGNKVEWYTETKSTHGIVAVSIDGYAETLIDLYSPTEQHNIVFTSAVLVEGNHTIRLRVTGTKNAASSGYYAIHDYFAISSQPVPPGVTANTGFGEGALQSTIQASSNTAVGYHAIGEAIKASGNTALGFNALPRALSTNGNVAVGTYALGLGVTQLGYNGNTAVGNRAMYVLEAGSINTAIGSGSGPIEGVIIHNSTAIGSGAKTTASNQVRIGSPNVTSIGGAVSWSTLSDGRFKQDIKENVSGLNFINGLRPVSYRVDRASLRNFLGVENSAERTFVAKIPEGRQTGFVAQEVDKLVARSGYVFNGVDAPKDDKDFYSIRYSEFVVPLVKAVQELSNIVEEQKAAIEAQQAKIDKLLIKIGEGDAGNKVGAIETLLLQNTPNPFNANTEIKMVLPDNALSASVVVYNLEGKQLKEIRVTQRGNTAVSIGASELNAGMYLYTLIVDGEVVDTKRMVLTK